MKTKTKQIGMALALVIALAVAVGLLWKEEPPQIIQHYRFAGVTYGTNHVQGTLAARLVNRLPPAFGAFVKRKLGSRLSPISSFTTSEPSLVVWFQPLGTDAPPPPASTFSLLADQNDVISGRWNLGADWSHSAFQVVPRRSRVLQCCFFEYSQRNGYHELGRVRIPNPLLCQFPQWQPEPLPSVKQAGDVEVRLENLLTGVSAPDKTDLVYGKTLMAYRPANRGEQSATVFDVTVRSLRERGEVLVLERAELSDATGNYIHSPMDFGRMRNSIRGTLWPDERAWRLKLELKRKSGYAPEELVTFKNVPVPAGGGRNAAAFTNSVGGIQVVLRVSASRMPNATVEVEAGLLGRQEGTAFDFVQATADTGAEVEVKGQSGGFGESSRVVFLKFIPSNANSLDITWAVQKTRSVEFLVKPPKAE